MNTDKKVCLIHAGKPSLFEHTKRLAQEHLNNREIDYIVFSHVEGDESGALSNWLENFENSTVVCNKLSKMSLDSNLLREAQILKDNDELDLGGLILQMVETPHFPHN